MAHTNNVRRRRSASEVKVLMLDAAREMFAAKGFHATTREIAERATVTEQLLFNHFASKQQLFAAAVLQPFEALAEQQLVEWQHVVALGDEPHQMMRVYVEGVVDSGTHQPGIVPRTEHRSVRCTRNPRCWTALSS
ncbi:helix-turn-helix domain-containing protein [Mycobacterium kiyosense]